MRVGFFSPLPPERSGIADYSYELLEELRNLVEVTAVVDDAHVATALAPAGVRVVGAGSVLRGAFDANVYQMGNNSKYHRFVFDRALDEPGLLVMHDPSLADYHAEICGGGDSVVFREEIAFDRPDIDAYGKLPTIDLGNGRIDLDRLEILMARRIVEASRRTLLNSSAMAKVFAERYPLSQIRPIHLPGPVLPPSVPTEQTGRVVFGVFGGVNYYKRVTSAVAAFVAVHAEFPQTEMVVAGRGDDQSLVAEIREIGERPELAGAFRVETALSLPELEAEMACCDVAIQLRWPTAGEMSATLIRSFGAGKPAVVTDVPQFAEIDPEFCWRVPVDEGSERDALIEIMRSVAIDPGRARRAGDRARAFVESQANYRAVASAYVEHLEESRSVRPARPRIEPLVTPSPERVNLVIPPVATAETWRVASALRDVLSAANVVVATVELDGAPPVDAPGFRSPLLREAFSWDPRSQERPTPSRRGPHPVSVIVVQSDVADDLRNWVELEVDRGGHVIAYCAPDSMPPSTDVIRLIREVDEVWTPTRFGQEALALYVLGSTVLVPLTSGSPSRGAVRSRDGVCRFLTFTGADSLRANVRAVIEAYSHAFPATRRGRDVELVVAMGGIDEAAAAGIRRAALAVGGRAIDFEVAEEAALIDCCDVLVALHHIETFGFTIRTALSRGRSVVATDGFGTPDDLGSSRLIRVRTRAALVFATERHHARGSVRGNEFRQTWGAPEVADAADRLGVAVREVLRSATVAVVESTSVAGVDVAERIAAVRALPCGRPSRKSA